MEVQAKNISMAIQKRKIFSDVSFTAKGGSITALIGPSGCGKTSVLNCMGLIQTASTGSVWIDGEDTSDWKEKRRLKFWRDHAAFIYQDYGIIEDETVAYNVTLNARTSQSDEVRELLEKMGILRMAKSQASVLSGGEKQRLGIARAIFKKASILYADEPTASLDEVNQRIVIKLLRRVAESGAGILIATHDAAFIKQCDQVINLEHCEYI